MDALLKTSRAVLARLTALGLWAGMALLALMAGLVVMQVVTRNLMDLGQPWADELARFSGIGLVFLVVPSLAARRVLVSVTIVPDLLGPRMQRLSEVISDLATLACAAALLWGFADFLPRAGMFKTPAMQIPNSLYYSLALTGRVLLVLVMLYRLLLILSGRAEDDASGPDLADTPQ